MAARFFVVGGVDTNWSTIGNWSLTSNGAGGQTVPSASDDVTLDGSSGTNCTLNTSARVAKTLTINGFTGNFQFDQQLSVSGSITFTTTAFTFTGTSTNKLRMIAAGTWTTNGKTVVQDIEIGATTTFTCTLATALTGSGTLLLSNTTSTIFSGAFAIAITGACTIQGSQTVTMSGNVTISGVTTVADANLFAGSFNWSTAGLTTTGNLGVSANTPVVVLTGGTWTGAAGILSTNCTIAGNVTFSGTILYRTGTLLYTSGTLTPGSAAIAMGAATTLNIDGATFPGLSVTANVTITLQSAVQCANFAITAGAMTFSGAFGITCTQFFITGATTGTTTLSGTVTCSGDLTLSNTTSTTFSGNFLVQAATMTISGTQTFTPASGQTITITGTTTISDACVFTAASSTFNTGGLTTTGALSGTQTITFNGTGTWTGAAGTLANSVTINTSGTLTISGTVLYLTGTITYTTGTVTVTASTLSISAACTLATGTMGWNNVTVTGSSNFNVTINTALKINGTLSSTNTAQVNFVTGGGGLVITTASFTLATAGQAFGLDAGSPNNTSLVVTGALTITGTAASPITLTSNSGSVQVVFTLNQGATQDVGFCTATRLDSSAGQTIYDYKGTLTTATNWSLLTAPPALGCSTPFPGTTLAA